MAKQNILTRAKKQRVLALMQQGKPAEAKPLLEQICRTDRSDAEALLMLGIANGMLGEHKPAEQAFRQIIKLFPNHPDANNNLGLTLDAQGKPKEAIRYFEKAVQLAGNNPDFVFNYANCLESLGELDQAKTNYEKAIALQPGNPEAFCNLGNVLQAQGEYCEAVAAFERAISISSEFSRHFPQIYINLGNALMALGCAEEAIHVYQQAVEASKGSASAYTSLGNAYLQRGRKDEALRALHQAITVNPKFTNAYRNLVEATRFQERNADVAAMENLYYHDSSFNTEDKINLAFSLGKVYGDLKDDERAFACYQEGNHLKRNSIDYSLEQDRQFFLDIQQVFDAEFFERHARLGTDDKTAIFIVGMPRSGTTLVEQILASHSQVYGAGELDDMHLLIDRACAAKSKGYPQGIALLSDTELTQLGKTYLTRLHGYAPNAQHITDKMPHNFLYLGLIHLLLPKAKIIHCRRDPIDNGLSIYKTLFTSGPASQPYAYDLTELGQYFRLYQQLMAHWAQLLPNRFYELDYEKLVANQEAETRRLLAYCELPWEEACLEFHRTQRAVSTASMVQVRQPIYANSVAGWRRYERQMQPFIAALQAGDETVRPTSA